MTRTVGSGSEAPGRLLRMAAPRPLALLTAGGLAAAALAATPAGAQSHGATTRAQLIVSVSGAGEELAPGTERLGEMHTGKLRAGQRKRHRLEVPAGRCVALIARGAASIDALDVALFRGRSRLGRDAEGGRRAKLRWCAEGDDDVKVLWTVRARRGRGAYAAAAFLLPSDDGEQDGAAVLEQLQDRVRESGGGYPALGDPGQASLRADGELERALELSAGRCYRVITAGADSLRDLDLVLLGPRGAELQKDGSAHGHPTLGVLRPLCPSTGGSHRLVLRAARGKGAVAWQVLGSPQQRRRASKSAARHEGNHRVGGEGRGFVPSRIRATHREVAGGMKPITDVVGGRLKTGRKRKVTVSMQAGRCYVAIAAGVPSVQRLKMRIVDPHGRERAKDRTGDGFPHARVCPASDGDWTVQLDMFKGYGRYGVQVFEGAR